MASSLYVESYIEGGTSAESANSYASYEEAFDVVKAICGAGKIARIRAPFDTSDEQIDSFGRLGVVQFF